MLIRSKITVDLTRKEFMQYVYATQNDSNTRAVEITLLENKQAWTIPAGTTGAVSFKKPDKTAGLYDTLVDGTTKAVTFEGNKLTAILAPQVLNVAGDVLVSIALYDSESNRLGTFPITVRVEHDPSAGATETGSIGVTNKVVITELGTLENPVTLNQYDITDGSIVCFLPGTVYYVSPFDLIDRHNVTFELGGATINYTGSRFLFADGCSYLSIVGGTILGNENANNCIHIKNCTHASLKQVHIQNIGSQEVKDGKGLYIVGDCTGLLVEQCTVQNVFAGQISNPSGDDWIHTFGIFINSDTNDLTKYTRYGVIRNCTIRNIRGIDRGVYGDSNYKKADGDGVFIQQLPYKNTSGIIECLDSNIVIDGCIFDECYKRGVKATARGVHIKNCHFDGDYWLAPIEFQYGHGLVESCRIINHHEYYDGVDGIVAGLVLCDGNVTVLDTYINCRANSTCNHGIVFNSRNGRTPFTTNDPWDTCTFERVTFDGVNRAVHVYGTTSENACRLRGLEVLDCRIQYCVGPHAVAIGTGIFNKIDSVRFIDFQFDQGDNRSQIKDTSNANFKYPIECRLTPTYTYELYSKYWDAEPTLSYGDIPTPPNTRIIYSGDIGDIIYKEYTGHGSRIFGKKAPTAISTVLGKQLLYSSKVGDEYTDINTGFKYICTAAGNNIDNIGSWMQIGGTS